MHFRLVPKSLTLDDFELLYVQIFTAFYATSHFWEATIAKQMTIDPYYLQQKCSPMTLSFQKYKVYADSWGFPWAVVSNDSGVVDD